MIVRAPRRTPVQEIEAILHRHTKWIEKNQQRATARQAQLNNLDEEQTEQLRQLAKVFLAKKTEYFAQVKTPGKMKHTNSIPIQSIGVMAALVPDAISLIQPV